MFQGLSSYGLKGVKQASKGASQVSTTGLNLMTLVGAITKSKDETIAAKDYAIRLLETMLQKERAA